MTISEFFRLTLALIAMLCIIGGTFSLFIGGLVLMSVKCVVIGGVLLMCGLALMVAEEHTAY